MRSGPIAAAVAVMIVAPGAADPQAADNARAAACDVLQAAFSTMIPKPGLYAPRDVVTDEQESGLSDSFAAEFANTGLSPAERAELAARARGFPFAPYKPECLWKGTPVRIREADRTIVVAFSRPLFSADGKLAVVGWLTSAGPRTESGQICVVRWSRDGWRAKCWGSWIT